MKLKNTRGLKFGTNNKWWFNGLKHSFSDSKRNVGGYRGVPHWICIMAWKMSRFKPLDLGVSLFGASKKYGLSHTGNPFNGWWFFFPTRPGKRLTFTVCELENGHRNTGLTHSKWWFSIVMLVYQRVMDYGDHPWLKILEPKGGSLQRSSKTTSLTGPNCPNHSPHFLARAACHVLRNLPACKNARRPRDNICVNGENQKEEARTKSKKPIQWIGLRENLQETIDFPIKYGAFRLKFSPNPIHWPIERCGEKGPSPHDSELRIPTQQRSVAPPFSGALATLVFWLHMTWAKLHLQKCCHQCKFHGMFVEVWSYFLNIRYGFLQTKLVRNGDKVDRLW